VDRHRPPAGSKPPTPCRVGALGNARTSAGLQDAEIRIALLFWRPLCQLGPRHSAEVKSARRKKRGMNDRTSLNPGIHTDDWGFLRELSISMAEKRLPKSLPKSGRAVHRVKARIRSADARPKTRPIKPSTKADRGASRAFELAVRAIDIFVNASARGKELAERKRCLTEGPAEFRGCRLDLRKVRSKIRDASDS